MSTPQSGESKNNDNQHLESKICPPSVRSTSGMGLVMFVVSDEPL
jgi:hypothetical protein